MAVLAPLDGVNDPWRWYAVESLWVGPAYEVSWNEGDLLPILQYAEGHISGISGVVQVVVHSHLTLADGYYSSDGVWGQINQAGVVAGTAGSMNARFTWYDYNLTSWHRHLALASGSGVVYLVQIVPGFAEGPVPLPELDILDYTGDLVVLGPYTWPDDVVIPPVPDYTNIPPRPREQVFNAYIPSIDLTPVSQAPAEAVRAGYAPLLPGQPIPLIWERVNAEPDDYR